MTDPTPNRPSRSPRRTKDRPPGASPASPASEAAARISEARRTRATDLDLSVCGLTAIPDEVFEMTWLESLTVDDNRIIKIPDEIARLTSLTELRIWNNVGSLNVSPRIGELSKLTTLVIGPGLSWFPEEIRYCRNLQNLGLGRNSLGALPSWLPELHMLEELQLWKCDLSSLPDY